MMSSVQWAGWAGWAGGLIRPVLQGRENRIQRYLPETADRRERESLSEVGQHLERLPLRLPGFDLLEQSDGVLRPEPAGHAFAAGFVAEETRDVRGQREHVGARRHNHNGAG